MTTSTLAASTRAPWLPTFAAGFCLSGTLRSMVDGRWFSFGILLILGVANAVVAYSLRSIR